MKMQKQMCLNPEVLTWRPRIGGYSIYYDDELWRRSHLIWSHAEQILHKETTDFDRVDAITTLKRSIDNRLRLINNIYKFKLIPLKDKPSGLIEILSYFGIIRPIMLIKLIEIRNAVEHEDTPPPYHDDCLSFLDFVWYFLRSTDYLRKTVINFVIPIEEDTSNNYYIDMNMNPENRWIPNIWGWVQPNMISDSLIDRWILLNVHKTETRASLLSRLGQHDDPDDIGRGKNPNDIVFHGKICGPREYLEKLFRLYFDSVR